jgi:hypothetical protein
VSAIAEKVMADSKKETTRHLPHEYGCEILFERSTMVQAKDSSLPNDAYLIWYNVDGETFMDVTRCRKRVDLFDFYYDKYGPGSVRKIDFGYGRVNPKLWGYKAPEKKKKR